MQALGTVAKDRAVGRLRGWAIVDSNTDLVLSETRSNQLS